MITPHKIVLLADSLSDLAAFDEASGHIGEAHMAKN